MLPSDMNLRIGKVKDYNNKILISSLRFKTGTNLKISLNCKKDKPDVKSKEAEMVKTEPDVKPKGKEIVKTKPNIEFKREDKQEGRKGSFGIGNNICLYSMVNV